jgi:hypothetical protein
MGMNGRGSVNLEAQHFQGEVVTFGDCLSYLELLHLLKMSPLHNFDTIISPHSGVDFSAVRILLFSESRLHLHSSCLHLVLC